ncbi:MAG: S1C family serine protease [Butyrivibrio sp.]
MYEEYNNTIPENNNMPEPEHKKTKGAKKGPNKFLKAVTAIVCAVILGGVAGIACYGVSYLGFAVFPVKTSLTENAAQDKNGTSAPVTYVNTISDDKISVNVYDVSDMVASVISSVVAINGTYTVNTGFWGGQYESTVSGSGIVIGATEDELLIVTNAHVIDNVDKLQVTFYDGSEVDVSVKGKKSDVDLAVLAAKLPDIPEDAIYTVAVMGETGELQVGQAAIAVGNSMGYGISVTTGCISALDKTVTVDNVDYEHLIQTDAAINPGNSGGALFNAKGEVIGINSVKMSTTGVEGMGYAISVSSVMDIIKELSIQETKEKLSDDERGYMGITGITITSGIAKEYGYPEGILIRSVSKNSAAANAGIIKNDILKSFDGEILDSYEELVEMMSYYAVGEEVEIAYYHMNNEGEYIEKTTTVVLTARPE